MSNVLGGLGRILSSRDHVAIAYRNRGGARVYALRQGWSLLGEAHRVCTDNLPAYFYTRGKPLAGLVRRRGRDNYVKDTCSRAQRSSA